MKIREQHANGSVIEVSGLFGVQKAVDAWRAAQNPPEEEIEVEEPKMKGTHARSEPGSRHDPGYEKWNTHEKVPIILGFQPNGIDSH